MEKCNIFWSLGACRTHESRPAGAFHLISRFTGLCLQPLDNVRWTPTSHFLTPARHRHSVLEGYRETDSVCSTLVGKLKSAQSDLSRMSSPTKSRRLHPQVDRLTELLAGLDNILRGPRPRRQEEKNIWVISLRWSWPAKVPPLLTA